MTDKITTSELSSNTLPGIDLQKGIERWDGWKDYFLTLNTFAEHRHTTAHDIAKQLKSGNRDGALELVHAIKGASGNLDLIETYECARTLELALRDLNDDAELPLQQFSDALAQAIESIKHLPSGRNIETVKPLVLIVDDDVTSQQLLYTALDHKFRIITATNGREAMEKIVTYQPHLILLDLGLPEMNGWVVLAEIKRQGISDINKVVIISTEDAGETKARALGMGARDFLTKPFDVAELNARLKVALSSRTDAEFARDIRFQADAANKTNAALESLVKDRTELYISAIDRLQVSLNVKSEFLANMSHELRTPLNAILGFAAIINDKIYGPLGNAKYQDYMLDIQSSGQHLLSLIENILDVSVHDSKPFELHEETVDMNVVVNDCISEFEISAEQSGILLCGCVTASLPYLLADRSRVCQILNNLISNAIKYTPSKGRIVISCSWGEGGNQNETGFKVIVADTGIGMDDEEINLARAPFGVCQKAYDARYEGIGLGLTLAENLMEAHGGSLNIKSKIGEGTVVILNFPENRIIPAGTVG
jgi:signal transduction histidine kinase/HPt (histidine-containing phosphotransfer) domain-containing protein